MPKDQSRVARTPYAPELREMSDVSASAALLGTRPLQPQFSREQEDEEAKRKRVLLEKYGFAAYDLLDTSTKWEEHSEKMKKIGE